MNQYKIISERYNLPLDRLEVKAQLDSIQNESKEVLKNLFIKQFSLVAENVKIIKIENLANSSKGLFLIFISKLKTLVN